jgi:hypothetical protein
MQDQTRDEDAVYTEAGERGAGAARFSLDQIATAFAVEPERVRRAMEGEFGSGPNAQVDSTMAQHLAEVILGDLPLDRREAALMQLGAFTPRSDAAWGPGSGPPAEESDRQQPGASAPVDQPQGHGSDRHDAARPAE